MFKKVLIAEDHESIGISVQKTLSDLHIVHDSRNYVFHCDYALDRIKKALSEGQPYELLITDLSFDQDIHQDISDGIELIKEARKIQPDLKVLIFSIENRADVVNRLIKDLDVNAYVPKGRDDAKDLKRAIETIAGDKQYISPNLKRASREEMSFEFTDYDKTVLSLIVAGKKQKSIEVYLKQNDIRPSSLNSMEKRLQTIKNTLNMSTTMELIAYCIERKII